MDPLSPSGSGVTHLCPSLAKLGSEESEDRKSNLYSVFRPRNVNPAGYDFKMDFWKKVVDEYVTFGGRVTFTLREAQVGLSLQKERKTPACLDEVLEELRREKTVMTLQEYYDWLRASTGWISWSQVNAKRLVTKLVPLRNPLVLLGLKKEEDVRFVHVVHVQRLAEDLGKDLTLKGKLMSLSSFKEAVVAKSRITDEDNLDLLLDYLKIKGFLHQDKIGDKDIILLGDGKISEVTKGKYQVELAIRMNEDKIRELEDQLKQAETNLMKLLREKRREQAKTTLRRKKLIEQRIQRLQNIEDSLTQILHRIEETEDNVVILGALDSGKVALSSLLKDNKMNANSVTEAMLDVQETLEECADINNEISRPLEDSDSADLEAELEALLEEDAAKERERLRLIDERKKENEEEDMLRRLESLEVRDGSVVEPEISFNEEEDDDDVPSPASVSGHK